MISDLEKQLAGISPWKGELNFTDLSINFNSVPFDSDTAIIVTSFKGHLPFLEATLKNYRLTGKFVICSYDPPFRGWGENTDNQYSLPNPRMFLLAHAWCFKHITYDADKRNGWFWDVKYASGIVSMFPNFKYVFTVNGDCLWEKPNGVDKIIEILGDGDLMSSSSCDVVTHTCSVIYKIDAFRKIIDYMTDIMEKPVVGSHSPECMLRDAIRELGLKEVKAPKQPMDPWNPSVIDHYNRYKQECTWREVLGFRNLTAEQQTASVERRPPVEKELCDWRTGDGAYLNSHERATLYHYYRTGDKRWLYAWWDQGEESWWDRKYMPIEYYGDKPILNEPPTWFTHDDFNFRNLKRGQQ